MSSDVGEEPVLLEQTGDGVRTLTLNRPAKKNALSNDLVQALGDAFEAAAADDDVRVVGLTGAGDAFCAGADLAAPKGATSIETTIDLVVRLVRGIRIDCEKPVDAGIGGIAIGAGLSLAQVHGACLAGGTDLALACDMVIASDDARIGFPAARAMGALPNNLWVYNCGPQWAKRLQLTGDSITGVDAAKIGVVLKSVPAAVLADEVEGLADRLALIDPDLLAANKRITNLALELMGAQTLQRLAGENDARAHRASAVRQYGRDVREHGLKETLRRRDEPFGEGYAQVEGPEGRLDAVAAGGGH